MKKIWALLLAVALLVTVLCMGAISANAAVTGTFVDYIVAEFAVPEIVDYSAVGDDIMNTHRMSYEYNPDLNATLLKKLFHAIRCGKLFNLAFDLGKLCAGNVTGKRNFIFLKRFIKLIKTVHIKVHLFHRFIKIDG